MDDILRVYNRDLVGLDPKGNACEVCGLHMHKHKWADLDAWGYAVNCSEGVL